jgi:hypothetical protein
VVHYYRGGGRLGRLTVEETGGFETVATPAPVFSGLPVVVVNPAHPLDATRCFATAPEWISHSISQFADVVVVTWMVLPSILRLIGGFILRYLLIVATSDGV